MLHFLKRREGGRRPTERSVFNFFLSCWLFLINFRTSFHEKIWDFLEYFLNTVCLILHWLHSEKFCRWINGSDPTKSLLIRLIQRFHGLFLGHLYPQIFLKVIILFSRRKKKKCFFFDLEYFSSYFCRHFRQLLATKCTGSFSRTWRFSQTNYGDSRGVWSRRVSSAFM